MAFPEKIERLHKLVERIVREEGTSSERFGLRFGLYPLWAVEKARRLLELERGQEAELSSSESSANQKLFVTALAKQMRSSQKAFLKGR